jgi:ABC-type antimicrobial peptide transport system permease subunit
MGHEYVFGIRTLEEANEQALLKQRITATLSEVFGGLDVLLAAIGLYGVMTFMVARRTQEIGIRMALGALPRDVLRMILGKSSLLVGIGIAVGIPCSLVANRLVVHLLFGLSPVDPLVLAGITALLFVTALVAGYVPAHRATLVDPIVSLRQS